MKFYFKNPCLYLGLKMYVQLITVLHLHIGREMHGQFDIAIGVVSGYDVVTPYTLSLWEVVDVSRSLNGFTKLLYYSIIQDKDTSLLPGKGSPQLKVVDLPERSSATIDESV